MLLMPTEAFFEISEYFKYQKGDFIGMVTKSGQGKLPISIPEDLSMFSYYQHSDM